MIASSRTAAVHYVSSIYVTDEQRRLIAMAFKYPDDPAPASLNFTIPSSTRFVTVFVFCNRHGLFQGSTLQVPGVTRSVAQLVHSNDDEDEYGPLKIPYL